MSGIAEMMFKRTSGQYDDEMAYKQRVQKYAEAVSQLQYNEQTGSFDYLPGSDLALKGQYNKAQGQVFDEVLGELGMLNQKVRGLENETVATKQSNAILDTINGQDYESLNQLIGSDERTKQMFNKLGVQSVQMADFTNPKHIEAFRATGANPEVLNALAQRAQAAKAGNTPDTQLMDISKAWPVVQGLDNKLSVASLPEFVGATGLEKRVGTQEKANVIRDFIARSYQAMNGVTNEVVNAKNTLATEQANQAGIQTQTAQLTFEDMQNYLASNPNATLAEYASAKKGSANKTAFEKEVEFMRENYGEEVALAYVKKKASGADTTPAAIKTEEHNLETTQSILDESGAKNVYDVDVGKLTGNNRLRFQAMVKEESKNIKPDEYSALYTLQAAAEKLNVDDLATTTGIADATINQVFDRLGLDLPDATLVQSANYNLIKNSIIKAAMGSQVTGNELERMTAQLGTEFRADKTVRVKMAETLDNLVAKYEGYKDVAPAFYAASLRPRAESMKAISNSLKGEGEKESASSNTKVIGGVEHTKQGNKWVPIKAETTQPKVVKAGDVVSGYTFLGGDPKDKNNWEKAK